MCVYGHTNAVAFMWRPEDNLQWFLLSTFSQDLGLELGLSDLGGKLFYLLGHLVGPTLGRIYLTVLPISFGLIALAGK